MKQRKISTELSEILIQKYIKNVGDSRSLRRVSGMVDAKYALTPPLDLNLEKIISINLNDSGEIFTGQLGFRQ